jgi:hypothetical protein
MSVAAWGCRLPHAATCLISEKENIMALIIGSLRPNATAGEIEVLERLKQLPEGYVVWPELGVYDRYPDFIVLVPRFGIAVLEVKDWVEVTRATPETFTVLTRAGQERLEPNPVRAVREKAFAVSHKLESEPRLLNNGGPHHGKLRVGYAYAVVFPRLPDLFIWQLGPVFDQDNCVISQDRLQQQSAEALLDGLNWRFRADLSDHDLDLVRQTLFPELKVTVQDREVGVMDLRQEQIAKTDLQPGIPEDEELPEQGKQLAANMVIRLVRGVVGSGKTLVLTRRARYLAGLHPEWNILVVTYNKALAHDLQLRLDGCGDRLTATHFHQLCADLLEELGDWGAGPVDDRRGALTRLLAGGSLDGRFDLDFLDDEIHWMKDSGITELDRYLDEPRTGRGRPISAADRRAVFEVFRNYQNNLDWRRRFDWEDVPLMVSQAIDTGALSGGRYDAILVDEAQDFAPTWFQALRLLLRPGGSLFLTADGIQRIYRRHSWKSLGLQVVGRTRILPRCYRSTYEIARAAYELVRRNSSLLEALQREGEDVPEPLLDSQWMRHGDPPAIHYFQNKFKEQTWVANRLKQLRSHGYRLEDIALFHRYQKGVEDYAGALREAGFPVRVLKTDMPVTDGGVTVGTMHAAKGLEYRVVFLLQLQTMFNHEKAPPGGEERRAFTADETRLLYVAMTRARERVYMTLQDHLPGELVPLGNYLKEMGKVPAT